MLEHLKKYEQNSIIGSILIIIVSLLLIFKPDTFLTTVIIVFGIIVLGDGCIHIVSYIGTSKKMKAFSHELFEGILEIIAGLVLIFLKKQFISILPVVVGIWIIVKSLIKFQLSLNLKSTENSDWSVLLFIAAITLILGIIIIVNPFKTMVTITIISGMFLLITAISNLLESIYVINKLK